MQLTGGAMGFEIIALTKIGQAQKRLDAALVDALNRPALAFVSLISAIELLEEAKGLTVQLDAVRKGKEN
jgi:hypothetical protein